MVPREFHRVRQQYLERIERVSIGAGTSELIEVVNDYFDSVEAKSILVDRLRVRGLIVDDPIATAQMIPVRSLPRKMRTARWFWIPKDNGSLRMACSPSLPLRVALGLLKDV